VRCGGDAIVGMNPIPTKQDIVGTLAINDEERGRDGIISDG
jgi:hypothetical protein